MINYNKDLIARAKALRKNMTPWEVKLWTCFLRNYPVRFQRQKVIDNYIADFYCAKACLVVELDGGEHYTESKQAQDARRTSVLQSYNLKVIRFCNTDIDNNFYEVCSAIDKEVQNRLSKE